MSLYNVLFTIFRWTPGMGFMRQGSAIYDLIFFFVFQCVFSGPSALKPAQNALKLSF